MTLFLSPQGPVATVTVLADASLTAAHTSTGEAVLFWCLAPVMVIAALGLLFARKAIHAALGVVLVMICLAFLYTAQQAPFLGVVQVVVYTGAVMMLFLFVLMLVGVDTADSLIETIKGQRWIAALIGVGLLVVLIGVIVQMSYQYPQATTIEAANSPTNPSAVAVVVFGQYVFAFEIVGALLITAALGALVLTHRERVGKKITQRDRARARLLGGLITPLPAPGVYARHNAVDVPALDPYGKPIQSSLSRVLRIRGQERSLADFDIAPPLGEGDQGVAVLAADDATPVGAPDVAADAVVLDEAVDESAHATNENEIREEHPVGDELAGTAVDTEAEESK